MKDDEATSAIAKELIKRWKKLIENKSESSNGSTDTASPSPVAKTVPSQTSASKSASGNGNSTNNSQVKKPPPITQSVSMDSSTDGVRSKCREMLSAALSTAFPEVFVQNEDFDFSELSSCETVAARIEECIYKEFKNTDQRYKNRVRSRVQNLKDNRNPDLRLNVLRGSITPERIAKMEANEMASEDMKKLREKITQEMIQEHQMSLTGGTSTDLIKCGKCKKTNVTYNQVQTRSADEPMTTFCLCNECGKRWKFC